MRNILILSAILAISQLSAPQTTRAQNTALGNALFFTTFFGVGAPAIPVVVGGADIYGVAEMGMGLGFVYGGLVGDSEALALGLPLVAGSVFLIRYDDKLSKPTLLAGHGALYFTTFLLSLPLAEQGFRDQRVIFRPHPGGASLQIRF